ncbi:zinc finger protein, putative [Bodo saltans]|uniref:Zinc finger protein, putative n=1 Tax=Bodo saltans TaxID=75058 RepID=A0A0S4IR30_BODSA|nr:zinc finger protein, putative [Bodo saltans]|eukprot:CUF38878.1 zinc finger protein, putative [Bodo saltans]
MSFGNTFATFLFFCFSPHYIFFGFVCDVRDEFMRKPTPISAISVMFSFLCDFPCIACFLYNFFVCTARLYHHLPPHQPLQFRTKKYFSALRTLRYVFIRSLMTYVEEFICTSKVINCKTAKTHFTFSFFFFFCSQHSCFRVSKPPQRYLLKNLPLSYLSCCCCQEKLSSFVLAVILLQHEQCFRSVFAAKGLTHAMLRFSMHIGNRTPSIDASTSTAPSEPEEVFCGGCDASLAPDEVLKCPCTAAVYCSSVCQAAAWPTHQTRCSAARRQQTVLICSNCRRTSMTMHACRCGQTFYCNHDCQKRHWFRHAHMCATLIHKHTSRIEHKSTQAGKGDISDTSDDDDEGKEDDSEDTVIITTHVTGKVQSQFSVESSTTVVSPRRQSVDSPLRDLPSHQTSTPMASFIRHDDTETIHPNAIKSPSPTSLGDVLVSRHAAAASTACLPRAEGHRRDHQVTTQELHSFGDDAEVEGLTIHIASLEHPQLLANATGISRAGGGIGISCVDDLHRGEDVEGCAAAGELIKNDEEHPETENPLQIHTIGADNSNKLSFVPPRIRRRQRAKNHPVTIKYTAKNPYVSRRGHSLSPSALNPFEMLPMIQVTVAEPKNSRDSSDSDDEHEPGGPANLIAADRGGDTLHTQHHQLQDRTLSGTISSCGASSQSMLKIAVYTDLNDRWSSNAPFGYKPTAADEAKTRKICRTSVLIVPK